MIRGRNCTGAAAGLVEEGPEGWGASHWGWSGCQSSVVEGKHSEPSARAEPGVSRVFVEQMSQQNLVAFRCFSEATWQIRDKYGTVPLTPRSVSILEF